jgi:hypothetical protein
MNGRRSFKSDDSFLEKLAIGATGARAVLQKLSDAGLHPVELERGSLNHKIWKHIKIKRLRVPDILVLDSATRIEVRAKTSLEISMSHSLSDPARGWDRGLENGDFVAVIECHKTGAGPTDWEASRLVQFIRVSELRGAFEQKHVVTEKPKGAEEGFEVRITWPAAIASAAGTVSEITSERLKFRRETDARAISLSLSKRHIRLTPLVTLGDRIVEGQILASVVPVLSALPSAKPAGIETYSAMLGSRSVAERYAAAKAFRHLNLRAGCSQLEQILADTKEHIFVRLETAATLAQWNIESGSNFIRETLASEYLEQRLEAVIILGELRTAAASDLLKTMLTDATQHAEIRAGAAWALGEIGSADSIETLVRTFGELSPAIQTEAARALRRIANTASSLIVAGLPTAMPEQRAGIAWALAHAGQFKVDELMSSMIDDNARRWAAYIIGSQDQTVWASRLEQLQQQDPQVYFAVTVLWQIIASWIANVNEY